MSITCFSLLFCLFLFTSLTNTIHSKPLPHTHLTSPYFSPTTLFPNYQNMLKSFKIFIYKPNEALTFKSPVESLFYTSLQDSPFLTQNAEQAHLFFVPFSSDLSTRSIARVIRRIKEELPYWNRTLGADHFYLSCAGLGYESDRNIVELKKNSVQISCFPASHGKFIPHKDITLPTLLSSHAPHAQENQTARFLGYFRVKPKWSSLVKELVNDFEFLIESEPSDQLTYRQRLTSSKFCLFEYGGDVSGIGEAFRFGCVPVVITDRPIQDLPFMDVLRWQEIAVFVHSKSGAEELKRVLNRTYEDRHEQMKRLGVKASQHFVWDELLQPFDSFHTVMYQLWLRRHTIRYARREYD
jgi:hypothetical protein